MKTLSKLIEYFYIFFLVNSKGHKYYENDKKYSKIKENCNPNLMMPYFKHYLNYSQRNCNLKV